MFRNINATIKNCVSSLRKIEVGTLKHHPKVKAATLTITNNLKNYKQYLSDHPVFTSVTSKCRENLKSAKPMSSAAFTDENTSKLKDFVSHPITRKIITIVVVSQVSACDFGTSLGLGYLFKEGIFETQSSQLALIASYIAHLFVKKNITNKEIGEDSSKDHVIDELIKDFLKKVAKSVVVELSVETIKSVAKRLIGQMQSKNENQESTCQSENKTDDMKRNESEINTDVYETIYIDAHDIDKYFVKCMTSQYDSLFHTFHNADKSCTEHGRQIDTILQENDADEGFIFIVDKDHKARIMTFTRKHDGLCYDAFVSSDDHTQSKDKSQDNNNRSNQSGNETDDESMMVKRNEINIVSDVFDGKINISNAHDKKAKILKAGTLLNTCINSEKHCNGNGIKIDAISQENGSNTVSDEIIIVDKDLQARILKNIRKQDSETFGRIDKLSVDKTIDDNILTILLDPENFL